MAPVPFTIALISGQANSGEVVLAAATFLSSGLDCIFITPVSLNKSIREEFYLSLDAFKMRESLPLYPYDVAKKIVEPYDHNAHGLFWLAQDNQGASIAREVISTQGESPEKIIYQSVKKLNLIEPSISPLPEIPPSIEFWRSIINQLRNVSREHPGIKSPKRRQVLFDKYVPMTPEEKVYYLWHKSLYEIMLTWQRNGDDVQRSIS